MSEPIQEHLVLEVGDRIKIEGHRGIWVVTESYPHTFVGPTWLARHEEFPDDTYWLFQRSTDKYVKKLMS